MGFTLATTTFSTKADETLATLDAYAVKTAGVVNIAKDIKGALEYDSLAGLKGGTLGSGLALLSNTATEGLRVSEASLMSGILGSNSTLMSSLKSLPRTLQSELLNAKGALSSITATVNGVRSLTKGADLSSLTGVANLISNLAGSKLPLAFTDTSGLIALGTNLVKQATALGIPDALKAFSAGVSGKDILSGMVKNLLPVAIGSSNMNLLSNLANCPLARDVTKMMPSFVGDFTKQFTLPRGTSRNAYPGVLASMNDSFSKLDPNWLGSEVTGAVNLTAFNGCSADMSAVLASGNDTRAISFEDADPATIDTSALGTPIDQAAALNAARNTDKEFIGWGGTIRNPNYVAPLAAKASVSTSSQSSASSNPLNTDKEYIGWGGSVKNPNYIPPGPPNKPIAETVPEAIAEDFPQVVTYATAHEAGSKGISFDDGPAPRSISTARQELMTMIARWKSQLIISNDALEDSYALRRDGDIDGANAKRAEASSLRELAVVTYNNKVSDLISELYNLGDTETYVYPG